MAKAKKHPAPPEIRAHDSQGNVRPADARYLTKAQRDKQQAYIEASAEAGDPAAIAKLRQDELAEAEEQASQADPGGPADAEPKGNSDGDK